MTATPSPAVHRPSASSVLVGAVAAIAVSLAINALVFALGWDGSDSSDPSWAPPGWFVGGTWVVLFGLMGAAERVADRVRDRRLIWALIAACAVYPLYTAGLESEVVGLVGNLVTLAFAVWIVATVDGAHRSTVRLLLTPLLAWMTFAAVLTAASL